MRHSESGHPKQWDHFLVGQTFYRTKTTACDLDTADLVSEKCCN